MKLLRPALYNCLKLRFGKVKIQNEGEEFTTTDVKDLTKLSGIRTDIDHWGETYRVCCPFCPDGRFRLYINHMWGFGDLSFKWRLLKCFNMECQQKEANIERLISIVWDETLHSYGKADLLLKSPSGKERKKLENVSYPGMCYRLDCLTSDHPACRYLIQRKFDPVSLGKEFGIAYCMDGVIPEYFMVSNRIIVPVYENDKMIGWQGRYIGEANWKLVQKYYNLPGWQKSKYVYNLNQAKNYNYAVIVEGVTDVWRYGPEAISLFGKDLSPHQLTILANYWSDKLLVVLLDPDAGIESQKTYEKLVRHAKRVLRLHLPKGIDPASVSRMQLRQAVYSCIENNYPGYLNNERNIQSSLASSFIMS
jgi:hypothetical protein